MTHNGTRIGQPQISLSNYMAKKSAIHDFRRAQSQQAHYDTEKIQGGKRVATTTN